MHSRRQFLKVGGSWLLATSKIGSAADNTQARGESSPGNSTSGSSINKLPMKLICVEEHVISPMLGTATRSLVGAEAPYLNDWGSQVVDGQRVTDLSRPHVVASDESMRRALDIGSARISAMDSAEITMQVLSYGGFPQLLPAGKAVEFCRSANDKLAAAAQAYPTRFSGFATLPWQEPEAAACELERSVKELGLKGALINGRPGATFLDNSYYEPVFSAFNALKVPLYIHPGLTLPAVQEPYYGGLGRELSARLSMFAWGWHNEAGVEVVRLLLSGAFDRYPNLQVISGHWGEMVPFFLQRLEDSIPLEATGLKRPIVQTYREHVYVSPSGMLTIPHFQFIHSVMGAERILYSVDYPYQSLDGARAFLDRIPVSADEKALIAHGNAERLLKI